MTRIARLLALTMGATLGCGLIAPQERDDEEPSAVGDVPDEPATPGAPDAAVAASGRWILTTFPEAYRGVPQTMRAHSQLDGVWQTTVLTERLRASYEWSPTGTGLVYETTEGPLSVIWLRSAGADGWSAPRVVDLFTTESRQRDPVFMSPTWSPRGDRFVLARSAGAGFDLRLFTETGGGVRVPVESFLGWTRDGNAIGVASDRRLGLYTMPADSNMPGSLAAIALPSGTPGPWATGAWDRLAFSADGRFTFVDTNDCADCQDDKLYVARVDGTNAMHEATWRTESVPDRRFTIAGPPAWSPQGALLQFDVREVTGMEREGATMVRSFVHDALSERTISLPWNEEKHWIGGWLPGPRPRLVNVWRRQLLDLSDLDHPVQTALPAGYQDTTFSPDGTWAVEKATEGEVCRWSLVALDESPPRARDFVTTTCEANVSWSADGAEAIFTRYGDGTRSTGVLALPSGSFGWSSEDVPGYEEPWDTAAYEPGGRRWLERARAGILVHDGAAQSLLPGGPDQTPEWQP